MLVDDEERAATVIEKVDGMFRCSRCQCWLMMRNMQ